MQVMDAQAGVVELEAVEQGRLTVERLAVAGNRNESLAEVAHDLRNLVTALGVYCDLLEESGVLTAAYAHYGKELRMVATASRGLADKLAAISAAPGRNRKKASMQFTSSRHDRGFLPHAAATGKCQPLHWESILSEPINNLARELLANRNLLAALAGPAVALTIDAEGGALPVRLTGEELTRVLVNLVKNAAEAMPGGGRISVALREFPAGMEIKPHLMLSVVDSGPGIRSEALGKIFESGYTTHAIHRTPQPGLPASHRGLGLSISRSIIEASGGKIHAFNCGGAGSEVTGARFEIELPVRER